MTKFVSDEPAKSSSPAGKINSRDTLVDYSDDEEEVSSPDTTISAEMELQLYLEDRGECSDPLRYWTKNRERLKSLFGQTRRIFYAPAITIGVEWLFSIAGLIWTDRRSRTMDENSEMQLFVSFNEDLNRVPQKKL